MIRPLLFALCVAFAATPVAAATLRGLQIHVSSDIVTIGDLFDGAADGDTELAKAPRIGKTILIDSGTLAGYAIVHHIDWRPRSSADKVIVFRDNDGSLPTATPASLATAPDAAATPHAAVPLSVVTDPLKVSLSIQGAGDKVAIVLDGGLQQRLLAGLSADTVLAVETIDFDLSSRHFTAVLVDAVTGHRYTVAGKAYTLVQVPVPVRAVNSGDTVLGGDLTWIEQRSDQLRSDTVLQPEDIVGKIAKRSLDANLPIQERFLALPTIIKRGDRVTMIVSNNGMMLTAEGRALDDAGMGETVRLANAASNRTTEGIVTGPGTARIRTNTTIAAATPWTEAIANETPGETR